MPKSKEFIDSSDSASDEETAKASASKKSKAKTKDDVSRNLIHFTELMLFLIE
jgi:hypothetical protein